MARNPIRFSPQANGRAAARKLRDAFSAAKSRTGGEGRLVAISAGGLLLAFVLLAALAPILMKAPAFLSSLIGFVLFALVFVATSIGVVALWRMIKAGAMEGDAAKAGPIPIFSQAAVESALSDAEDAGLRAVTPRVVQEAMTGRVQGFPIAVIAADGVIFAVIRLKEAVGASLLIAPNGAPWPFAFPNDGVLTPIVAPTHVEALVWTTRREAGLDLSARLASALVMSSAGGEVPYVSVRGRALVMMWRKADVGSACVIAHEVAKALA
jgi:hypothetical protein